MLNCLIVDDEPLAREGISNYVREIDFLTLKGTCENPVELMKVLGEHRVDLIFLDVQMPKMNGIDFLKIVQNPPMVILTTAYPSYALEGFQLNVLDYLLKPITFDRFFKAANKANDYHRLVTRSSDHEIQKPASDADYFFIKSGSKYEKIHLDDILYIQGMQNYVVIYTRKSKYMTLLYLKNLEENLDSKSFIRVHKSYIVSVSKIEGIEGNELFIQSHRVPISRNYREQVIQQVVNKKLWIK
ncbi:LytTR family DNA-binding domain-containing protein [Dyadobacter chenwenxiniae]|uniref:LytTR family DNA-binding domain-containing protein n=1 Tax=Dyadobacter chenwenxiniae TaxID=2906456 RepID=A0A9X1PLU2_9BACT|nr:LytTR family DNA-binding domain-containing protein [Dyadobacter chenwenxiniae]MCF0063233.1 LytTR family DNA-binding domain-containing protein [Dyadobacter chenwenxiniae]UON85387.1 LytTR family DNA-binding domain-containing protein [Dyadobacter chenwenxiniae]